MTSRLPQIISVAFHPLLMPFYAMAILFNLHSYLTYSLAAEVKKIILFTVFFTCFVIPVLITLYLLQKGFIRSLEMADRHERRVPFLAALLMYITCYLLLRQLPTPELIPAIVLSGAVIIAIAFAVTIRWKISIHMLGLGGLAGIIFISGERILSDVSPYLSLILLISGITGWARLSLQAHSSLQIYAGFAAGFIAATITLNSILQ
jgi:hypothetical protein